MSLYCYTVPLTYHTPHHCPTHISLI